MKYARNSLLIAVVFAIVLSAVGCQTVSDIWDRVQNMSSVEKATWMMSVFNAEYTSYLVLAQRETLTPEQKRIMAIKKRLLEEAYPLIKGYVESLDKGFDDRDMQAKALDATKALLGID